MKNATIDMKTTPVRKSEALAREQAMLFSQEGPRASIHVNIYKQNEKPKHNKIASDFSKSPLIFPNVFLRRPLKAQLVNFTNGTCPLLHS